MVRLPAYAPDLNPAEGAWANMKNGLGNLMASNVGQLAAIAPQVRTEPSSDDPHDVMFFRRHSEDDRC